MSPTPYECDNLRDLIDGCDRAIGELSYLFIDCDLLLGHDAACCFSERAVDMESARVDNGVELPEHLFLGRQRRQAAKKCAFNFNVICAVTSELLAQFGAVMPIDPAGVFV